MQLPQVPGAQRNVHQATEENVQLLMMSTGPIILSLGWQEKKRNCSDSCIYTSFSMLGTRGSNRPNSLVPRVLFLRLSREEER